MRRVLVVGISGAGKTTFARALAAREGLPFHEMDALAIGPGWSTPPSLVADIDAITAGDAWVFDSYGYAEVRDLMWSRADTLVWLDLPRHVTWPRMVRRSLRRSLTREPLFGGNVETWRSWLSGDHPVWHAWRDHGARRAYVEQRLPSYPGLEVVRLRTVAEADAFLRG